MALSCSALDSLPSSIKPLAVYRRIATAGTVAAIKAAWILPTLKIELIPKVPKNS
jgi:hypothetical protein